ncbi:hypothetical protein BH09SUM1_BH09SUM1_01200 [soil metagenome]
MDHSEFRGYIFALLFYKRISDIFVEERVKMVLAVGEDLADDPKLYNFVVPDGCLWYDPADDDENIYGNPPKKSVSRTAPRELGQKLNDAMIAIERANQPKFDGILTSGIDFNDNSKLPREKLVNLINHFSSQEFGREDVSDDVFGDAYEYLIRSFASKAGKSSGEFYTPREVAYLLAELIEPGPGHSVCDWASGSGGLLLQCRNYVRRTHGAGKEEQLRLHAQESNLTTYNISRINMILHGVKGWQHRQDDSLRHPRLVDDHNAMLRFDRIVMNPPFSLKDWGYNDIVGGDPQARFDLGTPPRDSGDWAWMQHVTRSLKKEGRAAIVMSQGILFRGQPEQTEEEDGQNQKADAEYLIRRGFVESDWIECIVVLPSKLFYGNSVPGCIVVLNKNKPKAHRGKTLMVWAARHFQKSNPQNILRPCDLMRILVPWRAFGDLEKAKALVPQHERKLIDELDRDLDRTMAEIADGYDVFTDALAKARAERTALDDDDHGKLGFDKKGELTQARKVLDQKIKSLEKIQSERDRQEQAAQEYHRREVNLVHETAADLLRICSDEEEARRYFVVVDESEVVENEHNLNLPRYVDTFEPEEEINLDDALEKLASAQQASTSAIEGLLTIVKGATCAR